MNAYQNGQLFIIDYANQGWDEIWGEVWIAGLALLAWQGRASETLSLFDIWNFTKAVYSYHWL